MILQEGVVVNGETGAPIQMDRRATLKEEVVETTTTYVKMMCAPADFS